MTGTASFASERFPAGISLYVHVPFCLSKCPYCDFNTYQGIEEMKAPYVDALVREIHLWGRLLEHPRVNTIFFGGGTPSYMVVGQIESILEAARASFQVAADAEITLESNPGDVTASFMEAMLSLGMNRLSIGVQAMDDSFLQMLGRRHTAAQAREAFQLSRRAGCSNINVDLMYGLPGQPLAQWEGCLESALELGADHLSLYCLTLEEGTPMKKWVDDGQLPAPDPDLTADMYSHARSALKSAGYAHYEISNWAAPGKHCLHNMAYWENVPYLGVGPGAHSSLEGRRCWDVSSPRLYIERSREWQPATPLFNGGMDWKALQEKGPVAGWEDIDSRTEMAETMVLGLRLLEGLDGESFRRRFGRRPDEVYPAQIDELIGDGLLEDDGGRLRLTEASLFLSNQVFMRFLD